MNWKISDLQAFVATVETLNLTRAAEKLQLSKANISKSISHLEAEFGVRLLDRNTRNVRTTEEGQQFYQQALVVLSQLDDMENGLRGLSAKPSGYLSLSLPSAFNREIVAPALPRFYEQYPDIHINLQVTPVKTDLIRDQLDLAITVGRPEDSEYFLTPLLRPQLNLICSPEYRDQLKHVTPEQLIDHIRLIETRYAIPNLQFTIGEESYSWNLTQGRSKVNDPLSVREAIAMGNGISLLPDIYAKPYLENGCLVLVNEHVKVSTSSSELNILTPTKKHLPIRTRVFIQFLKQLAERYQ